MDDPDGILYRLAARSDVPEDAWARRLDYTGIYKGVRGLDDKFVHCSTPEQAVGTAAAYFAGKTDVMLLRFSVSLMREVDLEVRWEDAEPQPGVDKRDGAFPHVYGGWIPYACLAAPPLLLALDSEGKHVFPSLVDERDGSTNFALSEDDPLNEGITKEDIQDEIDGIAWTIDVENNQYWDEENEAREELEYEDNPLDDDDDL